jgi:hypothetical protein
MIMKGKSFSSAVPLGTFPNLRVLPNQGHLMARKSMMPKGSVGKSHVARFPIRRGEGAKKE